MGTVRTVPDGAETGGHVLGIDSGGSGVRVGVARAEAPGRPLLWSSPTPAVVGDRGIDADSLLARVLPATASLLRQAAGPATGHRRAGTVAPRRATGAAERNGATARPAGPPRLTAVCVGAAGMAGLGDDLRALLPDALARAFGVRRIALASDAVTAYAGALGQRTGAVVAAGTGLVALGATAAREDGRAGGWRRADGWGHLLGDCGGGAWIGRAGLEAAMRAHDGREGGSPALLGRLEAVFGPAEELPGKLYPRPDRPAVLASFAPEVGRCASAGDPIATAILRQAAGHIAEAARAACPPAAEAPAEAAPAGGLSAGAEMPLGVGLDGRPGVSAGATRGVADTGFGAGAVPTADGEPGAAPGPRATPDPRPHVALTGGLLRMGEPLLAPLRAELSTRLPHAVVVAPEGDPLSGALRVAAALATGTLRLPHHPELLRLVVT
ncbi:N-acetylglucosamine kinase [Streptomyces sp. SAJ15]|uniref:N-acetylglucosamine kinase n=1 Tax=Streptomyces sp. SAJ15 TaxID=2011095 RepID=UPI001186BBE9|nr:BadF/BadG/BcrA/BcrD ATPase family protein [Streptomyces sp. SAJ15]TVL93278.1 ATPase [Streptomyces sp. SAJ15]